MAVASPQSASKKLPQATHLPSVLAPPETVTLLAVPTATLVLLASFGQLDKHLLSVRSWATALYLLFSGWQFFFLVSLIVLTYLWARVIAYGVRRGRLATRVRRGPAASRCMYPPVERSRAIKSLALLTAAYTFA